jgi:hypothetical protein
MAQLKCMVPSVKKRMSWNAVGKEEEDELECRRQKEEEDKLECCQYRRRGHPRGKLFVHTHVRV